MKWHTIEAQGYNLYLDTLPIGLYFRTTPLQIPFSKSSPENPSLLFPGGTSRSKIGKFPSEERLESCLQSAGGPLTVAGFDDAWD